MRKQARAVDRDDDKLRDGMFIRRRIPGGPFRFHRRAEDKSEEGRYEREG